MASLSKRDLNLVIVQLQETVAALSQTVTDQGVTLTRQGVKLTRLQEKLAHLKEKLGQAREQLSHPLESFVVGAICEELLRFIYHHEKSTWMKKFKTAFQPQEQSWGQLGIPKDLYDKLKKDTIRNASGVQLTWAERILRASLPFLRCRNMHTLAFRRSPSRPLHHS